jgi:hypothetical protein
MLVCINAAGEVLCPLILTSDISALGVFRDGIDAGMNLKVYIGNLHDILITKIEEFRSMSEGIDTPAVLPMDNCSAHLAQATIQLLSDRQKPITFPPHTSAILQMLDLAFFGVFKYAKTHLVKNPDVPVMVDHAPPMFKA